MVLNVTYQWDIRHVEHDHTLMFGRVLRYTPKVRFEHMVPVKER